MKIVALLIILLPPLNGTAAQPADSGFSQFNFLPRGLHFSPLKANTQEARTGLLKFFSNSGLKIDVGNSVDLVEYSSPGYGTRITAGIDFLAYGYSTSSEGFRLQIDALDGVFGGNLSFSKCQNSSRILSRIRILHLSGHFVDGHFFDPQTSVLIQGRFPRIFTKDFGELVGAYEHRAAWGLLFLYGGASYATLIRPAEIRRFSYMTGFEYSNNRLIKPMFNNAVNVYFAFQLSLTGSPVYSGSNNLQAGIKFGGWGEKGILLYVAYLDGRHLFAEYYDKRLRTSAAGIAVDVL